MAFMRTKNKCALSSGWESCCGVWEMGGENGSDVDSRNVADLMYELCGTFGWETPSCDWQLGPRPSRLAADGWSLRLTSPGSRLLTLPCMLYAWRMYRRRLCRLAGLPSCRLAVFPSSASDWPRETYWQLYLRVVDKHENCRTMSRLFYYTRNWCRACPGLRDPRQSIHQELTHTIRIEFPSDKQNHRGILFHLIF